MEEALHTRLLASAGLTALVGSRVVWIERPQGSALPAVTLQLISPGREYTYGGASGTSNPRVQADCWGRTYSEAKLVSRALIDTVEQRSTVGGVRFGPSFIDATRDMAPEELPGGVKVYRVSIDIIVWNSPA
jgi:hypothetical protein